MVDEVRRVTGFDAGLSGDEQIRIALKRIIERGGEAQMPDINDAIEDRLRPKGCALSDQGRASLRFFVNRVAVQAGYIYPHDRDRPGWRITSKGQEFVGSSAAADHRTMPIPDYQTLFRPILELAAKGQVSRQMATAEMAELFQLTPEERQQRIPSGAATYLRNRVGWAMTYLTKAGLIRKVAPKVYGATDRGRDFLSRYPDGFANRELLEIDDFRGFHRPHGPTDTTQSESESESSTPYERIDEALAEINEDIKEQVITEVLAKSPDFFERVVLDLLVAMGYGGSREDAAEHIGGVGDEGLDGRINQDTLGLDIVLVQAKRYARDRVVGRQLLQQFVGAMHGQGATKGVFITTSRFAGTAEDYVQSGSQLKLVLIDGNQLADLMLRYRIGIRVERQANVLALDNNYFEEEQ